MSRTLSWTWHFPPSKTWVTQTATWRGKWAQLSMSARRSCRVGSKCATTRSVQWWFVILIMKQYKENVDLLWPVYWCKLTKHDKIQIIIFYSYGHRKLNNSFLSLLWYENYTSMYFKCHIETKLLLYILYMHKYSGIYL